MQIRGNHTDVAGSAGDLDRQFLSVVWNRRADGRAEWANVAPVLSDAVRGKRYLLGDSFSMADVMVGGSLWLASFVDVLAPHDELARYHGRVSDRPAFQRAFADAQAP